MVQRSNYIGNECIFYNMAVFIPILSVFAFASLLISAITMKNHYGEEYGVVKGKHSREFTTQCPNESHYYIAGVMNLSGILPPPIC